MNIRSGYTCRFCGWTSHNPHDAEHRYCGHCHTFDDGEDRPLQIKAPWTADQVAALNRFQQDGRYHPFTCPGELTGCAAHRELIATIDGWVCACGVYRQDWAYAFMASDVSQWPGLVI